jgi:hypothetical protein
VAPKLTLAMKQQQVLLQYRGQEYAMLEKLKGKILYIHEGDVETPFSGTLDAFGEHFVRFVHVVTYKRHYSIDELAEMRKAFETNDPRDVKEIIPVIYKNKNDIATMAELYQL